MSEMTVESRYADHPELVKRVCAHMEENGLSQIKMAAALKLTPPGCQHSGTLCMWLGRTVKPLGAESERRIDDTVADFFGLVSANPLPPPPQAHAELVERLNAHMEEYQLS